MFVHCCHCTLCQRQTGTAFVLNALIEADRVVMEGVEPVAVRVPTESGLPHDIYRCPTCQVAVWSVYGGRGKIRFMRVGALDEPSRGPPDVHIFVRSKLPWVMLPPSVPAFDEFYDREALWPAESLARRRAALGAG
jgi:hypothetical protein